MNFSLSKKTGFKQSSSDPVIITDQSGKPFLDRTGLKAQEFNLPKGDYFLQAGEIVKLPKPVKYPFVKIPRLPFMPFFTHGRERALPYPYNFMITFGENPNKATIYWKRKLIVLDQSLKDFTLPQLYFIIFHEFAHAKYRSEKLTDQLAVNFMLQHGFNPSQIAEAQITALSEKQYARKKNMFETMINNFAR